MKILTHYAHATYQTCMSKISDVEYYHLIDPDGDVFNKDERAGCAWDDNAKCPPNIYPILAKDVDPSQFQILLIHWHPLIIPLCEKWPTLPAVFVEHTWPRTQADADHWKQVRKKYIDHTVFITPTSQKAWDID